MRRIGRGALVWIAACGGPSAATDASDASRPGDACDGLDLPICPPECRAPPAVLTGEVCDTEGGTCGNDSGDGCTCVEGQWSCTVKASFSPGCSLACQRIQP